MCSSDLEALPQRESVSINSGGAAARRSGQLKFMALQVSIKSGALPQRDMGSIKSGGAAAARIGQYKKRGRCRNEKWAVLKVGALPQREMGGDRKSTRLNSSHMSESRMPSSA